MKLYMFQCGTIKTKKHLLVEGPPIDDEFIVPVPFFLVEHADGNLLFDTGQPLSAVGSTEGGDYIPIMSRDDYVVNQLARIGKQPEDITHIVLSHLHSDHAGGLGSFLGAVCYLQERELPHRGFLDRFPLDWRLLHGEQEPRHDVFGDGKIQIVFTPGHTPGHQSLLLQLEEWGPTLLTSDAAYTDEVLVPGGFPGVCADREKTVETLDMIREMQRGGVRIITGHDPRAWAGLDLAPNYYI